MPTTVRVTVDDKVGTLALDNVAKRNARAGTVEELLQSLGDFERRGVRAVVIRTSSPIDVWSAGHDIDELPVRGVDPLPFADPLEELLRAVRGYPGAVIAMVHGTVWGGACDFVLNCDMVVADGTAAFAVTPARLGLPYSASGIQYFLARLPLNVVNELIMTADLITADRAYEVGILNDLVDAEALEDAPTSWRGRCGADRARRSAPTSSRRPRSCVPSLSRLRIPSGSTSCATTSTRATTMPRASQPSTRSDRRISPEPPRVRLVGARHREFAQCSPFRHERTELFL